MIDQNFILERIYVQKPQKHWIYTAYVNPKTLYAQSGGKLVHREAYKLWKGDIPEGHDIDHRKDCPKHCVNPDHLTPVSRAVNSQLYWTRKRGQMPRRALRAARWLHNEVTRRMA